MSSSDSGARVRYSVSTGNIPSIATGDAEISSMDRTQDISKMPRQVGHEPNGFATTSGRHVTTEQEQVTVLVKCTILSVEQINTAKQQFICTLVLTATWREPGLKGETPEDSIDWDKEWLPKIKFLNCVELDVRQKEHRLLRGEEQSAPYAQETLTVRGKFTQAMQVQDFPFDFQALTILLSSDWCSSAVVFDKDMTKDDVIIRENVLPSGAWSTCSHVITSRGTDTSRARDYNLYSLQAHVKRKAESFLWSTVVPQLLFVVLAFSSFAVPVSATGNRLLVTFVLLLAVISIRSRQAGRLTATDHLTFMDKYALFSHFFIALVAIGHAVANVVGHEREQVAFDRIWLYVCIVVFLFGQLTALGFALYKMNSVDQALKELRRTYEATSYEIERQRKERDWYAEKRARERSADPNGLEKPVSRSDQAYRSLPPPNKAYV